MDLVKTSRKSNSFVVLVPANGKVPTAFRGAVKADAQAHSQVLSEMQVMRGRIAVREGAVHESALDREGRHHMPGDLASWHLVRLDKGGRICGCARILVHSRAVKFSGMRLAHSEIAKNSEWQHKVRAAVEADIASSRKGHCTLLEPGGWVVDEDFRGGKAAAAIALGAIACSRLHGNCVAYLTATVKHGSSAMLRRLGASLLKWEGQELPRYYDPNYGCEIELLRLDTQSLNRRFQAPIDELQEMLACSSVLQAGQQQEAMTRLAA